MHSSSEQPLVGEERYVTTLITAVKETNFAGGELKMEKLTKENSTDVLVSIREKSLICPR